MKRGIVAASLFLSLSSIAVAQEVRLSLPYTRFVLANGLNVILHEDHSTPTVAVNTYYHVGSGREKPGRTGFAHLFEHIMFEGSGNVPEGKFDQWLEAAGGNNNGSTNTDRTNYYETVPSNALELPLFLESDRLGYLLTTMSPQRVDGQRDVVKNEKRQSYDNRPYGQSEIIIFKQMYPADHPYSWPTIGSMDDLTAASYDDVVDFFKKWYVPNNTSIAIAGDIDPVKTKALVEKWFNEIPRGPAVPHIARVTAALDTQKRLVFEDNVQLPRLYLVWHTPAAFTGNDAANDMLASILAGGKNSRLYKKLVYDLQVAQEVQAGNYSMMLGSLFQIEITARAGHTLAEIERLVQDEVDRIRRESPALRELQRAVNQYEAGFLAQLESVNRKADMLNNYFLLTGDPDFANEDFARYKALDPSDISAAAQTFLGKNHLVLSIVPKDQKKLAPENSTEVTK